MLTAVVKVFFRAGALIHLERKQRRCYDEVVAVIQKRVRRNIIRNNFLITRKKVCLLQRMIRIFLTKCNVLLASRKKSYAILIQSLARMYLARNAFLSRKEMDFNNKIVIIQSIIRKKLAYKRMNDLKITKENYFLIKFQSQFRRFLMQKKYKIEKQRKFDAAIIIQSIYRVRLAIAQCNLIRQNNDVNYVFPSKFSLREQRTLQLFVFLRRRCLSSAANTIQIAYRSFAAKKFVNSLRLKRKIESVVVLQCFVRAFLAKIKYEEALSSKRNVRGSQFTSHEKKSLTMVFWKKSKTTSSGNA